MISFILQDQRRDKFDNQYRASPIISSSGNSKYKFIGGSSNSSRGTNSDDVLWTENCIWYIIYHTNIEQTDHISNEDILYKIRALYNITFYGSVNSMKTKTSESLEKMKNY
jgi:hypothetical protein